MTEQQINKSDTASEDWLMDFIKFVATLTPEQCNEFDNQIAKINMERVMDKVMILWKHADKTFKKRKIFIDYQSFTGCSFHECELVYSGGGIRMVGNRFNGCKYIFIGKARNTLLFMKGIKASCRFDDDIVANAFVDVQNRIW